MNVPQWYVDAVGPAGVIAFTWRVPVVVHEFGGTEWHGPDARDAVDMTECGRPSGRWIMTNTVNFDAIRPCRICYRLRGAYSKAMETAFVMEVAR